MDLFRSLKHPDEILALFKYKLGGCDSVTPKVEYASMNYNEKRCYEFLNLTSRSFAAVIQALEGELRHAVCIFYLVLRALDTVEDDMTIPLDEKIPMLKQFYTFLEDKDWKYMKSQEKDKAVLEEFTVISAEFRGLKPIYRDVISDICKQMGLGMTEYLDKAPGSLAEWDKYCHYVAGLVGIGLSKLFSASELEDSIVGEDTYLSNSMGLFLQKTNIIRDYLEDVLVGREFWPKEVWGKYAVKMIDLSHDDQRTKALHCLNELISNALKHIPDVIEYMSRIKNPSVFNFCAIPQVMAIATLERCYNNPNVFTGVVKIRKGEAVRMLMEATSMDAMKSIFYHFASKIQDRIPSSDPSSAVTLELTTRAQELSNTDLKFVSTSKFYPIYVSCAMLTSAILWQYWTGVNLMMNSVTD